MGRSYYEFIDGEKYCVVVINASKCKSHGQLIKELYQSFSLPIKLININVVNEEIYDLVTKENYKLVVEKSKILMDKNKGIHNFLLENINDYKGYSEDLGQKFIVELI